MFESLLVITLYLMAVFTPVLIPATVHAVHAVRTERPTFRLRLAGRLPRPFLRPVAAPHAAAPAAA
ncbi:MAG TPA: hypothetical protein VME67_00750 [Mycobacterium sp.]|nr:hypothetical protein [Mycobacterium sp.]HTX93470.1 hypothetical protein [Mycobacterium sp.]